MAGLNLKAFCDESYAQGNHIDKPFVVAGYVAPASVWMEFEGRWNIALHAHGLPFFHMFDCENRKGPFRDRERAERERLQHVFIDIMKGFKIIGIAAGVSQDALAAAHDELSRFLVPRRGETQSMVTPYLFAFEVCVNDFITYIEQLPDGDRVAFVFDEQNEFEGRAQKMRGILVNCEQYLNRHRIGPLTYARKSASGAVPIQAADILAYEVMRELRDPGKARWQMAELRLGYGIAKPEYYTEAKIREFLDRMHAVESRS